MNPGDSLFNPDTFLDVGVEGSLSTKPVTHPVGQYLAMIKAVAARKMPGTKDPSKILKYLDISYEIDGNQPTPSGQLAKEITSRDGVTVIDGLLLDVNENGGLDMRDGMNFRLGRVREAVGQNIAGAVWNPRMLVGQPIKVTVSHRMDKDDSTIAYAQIASVEKP